MKANNLKLVEVNKMGKKLFLNTPDGVKVRRHVVSDNDVRFTVPDGTHPDTRVKMRKLVAWARNGSFVWLCNGYSA